MQALSAIGHATEALFGFGFIALIGFVLFQFFASVGGLSSSSTQQPTSAHQFGTAASAVPPNTTSVEELQAVAPQQNKSMASSDYLQLEIDLNTDALTGLVLKGKYATQKIELMPLAMLIDLWRELARIDSDGRVLLESYLDKVHPIWRNEAAFSDNAREENDSSGRSMTKDDAYDILGLKTGAGVEEIKNAYRQAINKNHPDKGGSNQLTALINKARCVLLAGGKNCDPREPRG